MAQRWSQEVFGSTPEAPPRLTDDSMSFLSVSYLSGRLNLNHIGVQTRSADWPKPLREREREREVNDYHYNDQMFWPTKWFWLCKGSSCSHENT